MPEFEFVHVDRPDDVKRHSTKIRRHVMKDIGKARRRPKKRGQTTVAVSGARVGVEVGEPHDLPSLAFANPNVDGSLSAMVYPTEMDEVRLDLARYMFAEARANYRPFRFPWMSMGLSDPAAWHITMANAVLFRGMRPGGGAKPDYDSSLEAMKWYTRSLESITRRLADPAESSGEGLIVAVAGFICHDSSTGNFARQEVHMKGLKRLVENRGGLEELSSPFLRLMISWHDLLGASYRDAAPLFGVPRGSIAAADVGADTRYLDGLLAAWGASSSGDVARALRATAAVAGYINGRCGAGAGDARRFWQDEVLAARLLAPALHAVLSLEAGVGDGGREALRRAALLFLAGVKARFGAPPHELARHRDAFRQVAQQQQRPGVVDWAVVPAELHLWAQVTCALLHENGPGRAWNVVVIAGIMRALGLATGAHAIALVRRIIWVDALAVGKVDALCREIDSLVAADAVRMGQGGMAVPLDTRQPQVFAGEILTVEPGFT
ncbi:hypothetical protein F4775DRAFT_590805 [Biscogniauxia sp. FL1348]|nr:hypothetical protein F4775DRAFT_590805 [Biscogniauxia sp. FL1348]